jgi:hypothetical protein
MKGVCRTGARWCSWCAWKGKKEEEGSVGVAASHFKGARRRRERRGRGPGVMLHVVSGEGGLVCYQLWTTRLGWPRPDSGGSGRRGAHVRGPASNIGEAGLTGGPQP